MNWGPLLKALPALLGLVTGLFGKKKTPPKRADEVLGSPNEPTKSEDAKAKADAKAREKYDLN